MRPLGCPEDTDPKAWEVYLDLMRKMPAEAKMIRVSQLNSLLRGLMASDLRQRHPDWSEEDVFLSVAARCIGPDLVRAAYGREPRIG